MMPTASRSLGRWRAAGAITINDAPPQSRRMAYVASPSLAFLALLRMILPPLSLLLFSRVSLLASEGPYMVLQTSLRFARPLARRAIPAAVVVVCPRHVIFPRGMCGFFRHRGGAAPLKVSRVGLILRRSTELAWRRITTIAAATPIWFANLVTLRGGGSTDARLRILLARLPDPSDRGRILHHHRHPSPS